MKSTVFKIILSTVGIIQGVFLLLTSSGILIRILGLKEYQGNEQEIFLLEIVIGFFLILAGLTVWGLIKRNALFVFIPTALIIFSFIIKFISVGLGPGTKSEKKANDSLDTLKTKKQPYISLVNSDCISKDTYQIFKINNVEKLDYMLAELNGVKGSIVFPKNPIGNGDFKIKIAKDTKVDSLTIIITDYTKQYEELNNAGASSEKPKVIINQKIRICD